ncbi:MAG: TetR/AcrR family transcriptional regulator [Dehalococcoidia bacterium]
MTTLSASPAPAREADVRERIFASALRHFSQKGFAATSLREVSIDAQTTKPMIYYYFKSKEGLYGSIVTEILEEMAGAIRAHLPTHAPARDQVIAYAERYLDHFLAQEEIIALVLREVFGLGGAPMAAFAETLGERVRQPLDEVIRCAMESGAFRKDHVYDCATAITGILNMFILAHVFGGAPIERDAPLQQVRYYIAGLESPVLAS